MKNPFEYGGVVGRNAFCNRKKELADLKRIFENGSRLFLYSERRVGKTSLVMLALQDLSPVDYIVVYVDLWPTTSSNDFALRLAKAVADSHKVSAAKLLEFGKKFFSSFQPSVSLDQSGSPQILFGVTKDNLTIPALEEVLKLLPKIAQQSGKRLVVVLDEFQQIVEYGSDTVEKTLRSAIQHHSGIAYVFLGSRRHIIESMFLDKQRPLYRSASHYPLPMIDIHEWMSFILQKFQGTNKSIEEATIQQLCQFTQCHPFYTQHLCHALWELTEDGAIVHRDALVQALDLLLKREAFAYSAMWDSLTGNPKILITAIAAAPGDFKPFGADFVKNSGLRSPSNVQRAAQILLSRELIDKDENGVFYIPDKFFKLWIQRMLFPGVQYADVSFLQ